MVVQIRVLLLKCEYMGIYDSFNEFYKNIERMFLNSGVVVYVANNLEEAMDSLKTKNIDFTINVGQYPYYYKDKPLYDLYEVVNYQWIIDNPLRYLWCDTNSQYNRMIFIDQRFGMYPGYGRNDYISMSLPYSEYNAEKSSVETNTILAPLKVKDLKDFEQRIMVSKDKNILSDFIQEYNLDCSFNLLMLKYIAERKVSNLNEFFEIANGYIRVKKRLTMLQAIKEHEVVVLSEKPPNTKFNDNITFVGRKDYIEYLEIQKKHKLVLNCNPNFDVCIHDRVAGSIMNGKVIISDTNEILSEINMPMCIRFKEMAEIDKLIEEANNDFDFVHSVQRDCLRNGRIPKSDYILNNFFFYKK